jgi:ABC-type transport system involved in cytochrome bd biosynthesis fused ATPase/permease subunit
MAFADACICQTDQAIQRTIRAEMQQSIVITIAHRLESVVDCEQPRGVRASAGADAMFAPQTTASW